MSVPGFADDLDGVAAVLPAAASEAELGDERRSARGDLVQGGPAHQERERLLQLVGGQWDEAEKPGKYIHHRPFIG